MCTIKKDEFLWELVRSIVIRIAGNMDRTPTGYKVRLDREVRVGFYFVYAGFMDKRGHLLLLFPVNLFGEVVEEPLPEDSFSPPFELH